MVGDSPTLGASSRHGFVGCARCFPERGEVGRSKPPLAGLQRCLAETQWLWPSQTTRAASRALPGVTCTADRCARVQSSTAGDSGGSKLMLPSLPSAATAILSRVLALTSTPPLLGVFCLKQAWAAAATCSNAASKLRPLAGLGEDGLDVGSIGPTIGSAADVG